VVIYVTMAISNKSKLLAIATAALIALVIAIIIEYPFAQAWLYQNHLSSVASTTTAWPHYGIAAGGSLPDMSASDLDNYMSNLQTLGAGWVRFDFDWSRIQPDSASSYDWSAYDTIVRAANRHGLHVIGIIDFTPAWARPGDCQNAKQCAPADPATYGNFASAVAARYKSQGVRVWEIWNEPNTQTFWLPTPNTDQYSKLLRSASVAIHDQESNAIVLSASPAPASTNSTSISPVDFVKALYADGDKTYFDAVGDHPYTFPLTPDANADQAWAQMNTIRSIMVKNGDSAKKVWITEFGAPTNGPGPAAGLNGAGLDQSPWHVTPALQAQMFSEAFNLYKSYNWVGPMLLYSYQDAGSDPSVAEDYFGLVDINGNQKPAYDVVHQAFTQQ
jgi:hypothetical protein